MIYLVRHAHAGPKQDWHGPDELRPLSAKGHRQAYGLATELRPYPVGLIVSSPAVRCRQTVEPVAAHRGMGTVVDDRLAAGSDLTAILAAVLRPFGCDALVCTHGEVIGRLFDELRARGAGVSRRSRRGKGATWLLELDGDAVVRVRYRPARQAAVPGYLASTG